MSLSKESKMRILENFYGLDYLFFGKQSNKVKSCCPALMEEYVTSKGALLHVMIEMFRLIGHKPKSISEKMETSDIKKLAQETAKIARENSKLLVSSIKGREEVKNIIKDYIKENEVKDMEKIVKNTIREKAFNLSVDNLLIARTITEADDSSKLNEWEGSLIEEAYKTIREDLVDTALIIIDSTED